MEVKQECEAFKRFCQRIRTLETQIPQITQPSFRTQQIRSFSEQSVRDVIELCYRETVMAVDHYEQVYGNSFGDEISAEFGNNVAVLILEATLLSPLLKQRLLQAAQQCINSRRIFLKTLEDEQNTLKAAHSTCQKIQQTLFSNEDNSLNTLSNRRLIEQYESIRSLDDECEKWLHRRQQQIHDRRSTNSTKGEYRVLCPYLYTSLDVTYPILTIFVILHEQLQTRKQQIFRSYIR
ncbi:hypothetical protein EGH24_12995 [Halonotius terrestris]|jgi:hypothetical protein|uniref:DUF7260 domain-containing protein n=1 Tax=Halonotius terrestris TaxID=2487750 RepID=A0A8J8P9W1_9EURY|nr:hypothetical protein [Halonotius terrestris]TQQ78754.1 hypothetical protein EGH24_12995 [Halonotius terrestris]